MALTKKQLAGEPENAWVREVYEASFPEDERRDFDDLFQLFNNDKDLHIYTVDNDGHLCAFIIYWTFADFVYIEHFAVDSSFRNRGLGSSILQDFMQENALPIVLEVEIPSDETSRKRISFYERSGFIIHPQKYIQPAYSSGKSQVEMRLMSRGSIDFDAVKGRIYERVYGIF
ncbi:MAG: GNAT family N-acetyltransferase [Tannerellaceae bacterium]|jgi:ribosomal protein S18 acetylase RimI-like enzyme|nr:GNAT family N-acetyltransferase [Tannerellaceae bacterium]